VIFGIAKVSVTKRNPKLLTRRKQPTHELQKARNNERDLIFSQKISVAANSQLETPKHWFHQWQSAKVSGIRGCQAKS
jgi:hypothetical protein